MKQSLLRERLIARNATGKVQPEHLFIPPVGQIDSAAVAAIQSMAARAAAGDITARDVLWFAFQPRLDRVSHVLKPWPNTPSLTGIWERNDVRQESWIIFAELLDAWDREVSFVPYLLARFPWRLRDRILRGIGKRQNQFGSIKSTEKMFEEQAFIFDDEQPESVAIARRLLEELLKRFMTGEGDADEMAAWTELVNTRLQSTLVSPDYVFEPPQSGRTRRWA